MNFLEIVRTFCERTGLPQPSYVTTSSDAQILQIAGLLNEVCEDITSRWDWQAMSREVTFTTVAGEDQGNFYALLGLSRDEFKKIVARTIYNRTTRLEICGPVSAASWAASKAMATTGPLHRYRIRQDKLWFDPPAVAGHSCAFEVFTHLCVTAADGLTFRTKFEADTDTFALDERLLLAGLRWKWKAEKGLDYAEELVRYETFGANLSANDATKPVLRMDGSGPSAGPGIFVSPGTWNLP